MCKLAGNLLLCLRRNLWYMTPKPFQFLTFWYHNLHSLKNAIFIKLNIMKQRCSWRHGSKIPCQSNIGRPPYATQYFLVLDFIVHLSHYMFRPRLAAIFRWFTNTKNIQGSHYIYIYIKIPCVKSLHTVTQLRPVFLVELTSLRWSETPCL
jgi:hypothetical protein